MPQLGMRKTLRGRAYEDYVSMHKHLRHTSGDKVIEHQFHHNKASPASATGVEMENAGTTAHVSTYIGKVGLTIVVAASADAAGMREKLITLVYKNTSLVTVTAAATLGANSTTETAFTPAIADFYYPISATTNATIGAGQTIKIGITGLAAPYVTFTEGQATATDANMIGVGTVYGWEDGNQADTGYIADLVYYDLLGYPHEAIWTFPADSSAATKFYDKTSGLSVKDFYRIKEFECDHVALDELRVGNLAKDAWYGTIDIGNYEMVSPHYFVPAEAVAKFYIGDIKIRNSTATRVATIDIFCQPKGCLVQERVRRMFAQTNGEVLLNLCFQLEPLSEISVKLSDDTNACNCDIDMQCIEVSA